MCVSSTYPSSGLLSPPLHPPSCVGAPEEPEAGMKTMRKWHTQRGTTFPEASGFCAAWTASLLCKWMSARWQRLQVFVLGDLLGDCTRHLQLLPTPEHYVSTHSLFVRLACPPSCSSPNLDPPFQDGSAQKRRPPCEGSLPWAGKRTKHSLHGSSTHLTPTNAIHLLLLPSPYSL